MGKDSLLDRLETLNSRANRKGLGALDPTRNKLIRIGMEIDDANHVTKNGYGVFQLSWQTRLHCEWANTVDQELHEIRERIKRTQGMPLRFLIWTGMGGSAEDKSMYNAVGLLK